MSHALGVGRAASAIAEAQGWLPSVRGTELRRDDGKTKPRSYEYCLSVGTCGVLVKIGLALVRVLSTVLGPNGPRNRASLLVRVML